MRDKEHSIEHCNIVLHDWFDHVGGRHDDWVSAKGPRPWYLSRPVQLRAD